MAILGIPMMLAPAIGPTLGGYLVDYWSWRMAFYVNVPVVIAAIAMGLAWIEDTPTSNLTLIIKGLYWRLPVSARFYTPFRMPRPGTGMTGVSLAYYRWGVLYLGLGID